MIKMSLIDTSSNWNTYCYEEINIFMRHIFQFQFSLQETRQIWLGFICMNSEIFFSSAVPLEILQGQG